VKTTSKVQKNRLAGALVNSVSRGSQLREGRQNGGRYVQRFKQPNEGQRLCESLVHRCSEGQALFEDFYFVNEVTQNEMC
jgi:hypothetical protein